MKNSKSKTPMILGILSVVIIIGCVGFGIWNSNNQKVNQFATVDGHDLYKAKVTSNTKANFSDNVKQSYDELDMDTPSVRLVEGKTKAPNGSVVLFLTSSSKTSTSNNQLQSTESLSSNSNSVKYAKVKDGKFKAVFYYDTDYISPIAVTNTHGTISRDSYTNYYEAYAKDSTPYTVSNSGKLIEP